MRSENDDDGTVTRSLTVGAIVTVGAAIMSRCVVAVERCRVGHGGARFHRENLRELLVCLFRVPLPVVV